MDTSNAFPKKGFYVHYKHDPNGEPFNYMYEVVGIARNTEDGMYSVLYKPMYKNQWLSPAEYFSRPLEMFIDMVDKDGVSVPRFALVTDSDLLSKLKEDN